MKKVGSIFVSLLLCLSFAACSTANNSSSSSSQSSSNVSSQASVSSEKSEEKVLIMATEAGFAPYEYYDGDKIVGVDVDIANEIAKAMGATLKIADMDFGAVITAVDTGKANFAAAGLSITPEREQQVDFSIEYAISEQVILVKEGSEIKGEADFQNKTIGSQLGTVADFYIADLAGVKSQQYTKYADAANDLINGRIDAIVMDKLPAENMIKAHSEIKMLEEPLFTDKYAIAVKKGDKETLEQINAVLNKLIDEGKIEEFTINHTSK